MLTHWLFIGNVSSHWIAFMSGLASVLVAIYQTLKKNQISARSFWSIAIICLVVACDQAWQDEHRNTQTVIGDKASIAASFEECSTTARVNAAFTKGLENNALNIRETVDQKQSMNDKEANDLSTCLLVMSKLNPQVTRKLHVVTIAYQARDSHTGKMLGPLTVANHPDVEYSYLVLITTNENESRFHGILKCNNPFIPQAPPQLSIDSVFDPTTTATLIPAKELNYHSYELRIPVLTNEWNSNNPVYMPVSSIFSTLGACDFNNT